MSRKERPVKKPKMVNLRIDPDLWAEAKAQAAREDRALVRFVERALRAELDRKKGQS